MFTGIIETTGKITTRTAVSSAMVLTITKPTDWELVVGQSIAVNGACLTVTDTDADSFSTTLMPETLARTTFSDTTLTMVNLERAMPASGRFEGHVVQGHVDAVGMIVSIESAGETARWEITFPSEYQNLLVEKGSVTVDGVSLTVVSVEADRFAIGLIPHTLTTTTLGARAVGDRVNLEFDILGKYLRKQNQ